jgi:hypothetical protein
MDNSRHSESGRLGTLWETKTPELMTGEILVTTLEAIVKAAKLQNFAAVKLFGEKAFSSSGKRILNINAQPADPYVKGAKTADPNVGSRTW